MWVVEVLQDVSQDDCLEGVVIERERLFSGSNYIGGRREIQPHVAAVLWKVPA
jgi:hypothetical protein